MEIMDRLAIKAAQASVNAGYPDAEALLIVELEGEALQVEAEFAQLQGIIETSALSSGAVQKRRRTGGASGKGASPPFLP